MRTPILFSASRAHYHPLNFTKPHHHTILFTTHLTSHHRPYSSTKPPFPLPLQLTPSDLNYNKTLNPPPTTRARPFAIPPSDPLLSLPRNLLAKGVSILTFYKTGLKSILLNRRLHSTPLDSLPDDLQQLKPYPDTRGALLLASRLKHDLSRLIPLSLILLICAEMTPVVILWTPTLKLTPLTCRLPREVEAIRQRDRQLRQEARQYHKQQWEVNGGGRKEGDDDEVHTISEVLRVGKPRFIPSFLYPFALRRSKLDVKMAWILADDAMIHQGGGEKELVWEEVKLAAEERGIEVLGREEKELRGVLGRWLDITSKVEDLEMRRELVKRMVLVGEEGWKGLEI